MHIGIDLGGTKTEIILLDENLNQLWRKRLATPQGDYKATLKQICQMVAQTEDKFGPALTVGIGIPGAIDDSSGLVQNANSVCLIGKPMKQDLSRMLAREIRMHNDADCFIWSESLDGAAKGAASAFGVILGTGVGGGLVYGQKLIQGPNGIAGEWGHNPLAVDGNPFGGDIPCYCGRINCVETFLSGPGFAERYYKESGKRHSMPEIVGLAQEGVNFYVQTYAKLLALALGNVINLFDPEVIVLGGGLSKIPALYQQVPRLLPDFVFSDSVATRVEAAKHGDSSGVRGAAMLFRWQANQRDCSD